MSESSKAVKSHGQTPLSFGVHIDKGRRIGKREKVYLSLTSKPCNAMDRSQETDHYAPMNLGMENVSM